MKATQLYRKHSGDNSATSLWRNSLLINMRLTYEDKVSIKLVCQQKGWGAKRICKEFPNKNWAVSSVKDLRKIDKTNSISRKVGSGWKQTVRTTQNIEHVAELICSQEGNPGSSKSPILLSGVLCSKMCREFRSWVWRISKTECVPAGPVSTNNWSTKPLISGNRDWKL